MTEHPAVEAARRAAERAAVRTHRELARGTNGLATVASVAPLLGMLLVVRGIVGSFRGVSGEKSAIMAAYFSWLADALAPSLLGLATGLIGLWGWRLLSDSLQRFRLEMRLACEDVAAACAAYPPLRRGWGKSLNL